MIDVELESRSRDKKRGSLKELNLKKEQLNPIEVRVDRRRVEFNEEEPNSIERENNSVERDNNSAEKENNSG